jgi:hypothetical protein
VLDPVDQLAQMRLGFAQADLGHGRALIGAHSANM